MKEVYFIEILIFVILVFLNLIINYSKPYATKILANIFIVHIIVLGILIYFS